MKAANLNLVGIENDQKEAIMYILLSLLLVGLGIVMILKPKLFFDVTEGWKSHVNDEPSKLYLFSTRLGGVMCLLVGIMGLVILIFLV